MAANSAYPWDVFDPVAYVEHNYASLRDDDRQILRRVRDFFATVRLSPPVHGIDVGSGPNIYPALCLLPLCDSITLWERAASNARWLSDQIIDFAASWDPFWRELAQVAPYRQVTSPRTELREKAQVKQASIFDLPERRWEIGTMFFVAESISGERAEFQAATRQFIRALTPGAPFAAAFMEGSRGYRVGDRDFPAVRIGIEDVRECLDGLTYDVDIQRILSVAPLRKDTGMLLALGRAGSR